MKAKNPKYSLLVVTSLITSSILCGEIATSYASSVEYTNAESIIRSHSNKPEITQPLNQEPISQRRRRRRPCSSYACYPY